MAEQPDKQQKTEEATPQRRREAREKGQVALSTGAVSAMSLAAVAGSFLILGGFLAQAVGGLVATSIEGVGTKGLITLESDTAAALVTDSIRGISSEFFLVVVPALLVAALVGYGQAGLQFAPKAVSLDPAKINPAKGVKRLFSARSFVRATMAYFDYDFTAQLFFTPTERPIFAPRSSAHDLFVLPLQGGSAWRMNVPPAAPRAAHRAERVDHDPVADLEISLQNCDFSRNFTTQ